MANRRMFSKLIVKTDAFMDMPPTSQLLYFHLSMEADDDGFVSSPKKIMKTIGSADDDYKILIAKRFILEFESGVCVIKHWLIHNFIRSDRYSETQYIKEKSQLIVDEKTNKYSLILDGIPDVIPLVATGKGRVGKGKVNRSPSNTTSATADELTPFELFWIAYPRKVDKVVAKRRFENIAKKEYPKIMEAIKIQKNLPQWQDVNFIPHPSTWLNQQRWEDEAPASGLSEMELHAMACVKKYPLDKSDQAQWEFTDSGKYKANDLLKVKHIIPL